MTDVFWFLLGLWIGGSAGFLLSALMSVARDGDRRADAALAKLRRAARRMESRDREVRFPLQSKTARAVA